MQNLTVKSRDITRAENLTFFTIASKRETPLFAHESYKWDPQNNCVTVCVDGEERNYKNSDFETIRKDLLTMFEEVNTRCKGDERVEADA